MVSYLNILRRQKKSLRENIVFVFDAAENFALALIAFVHSSKPNFRLLWNRLKNREVFAGFCGP